MKYKEALDAWKKFTKTRNKHVESINQIMIVVNAEPAIKFDLWKNNPKTSLYLSKMEINKLPTLPNRENKGMKFSPQIKNKIKKVNTRISRIITNSSRKIVSFGKITSWVKRVIMIVINTIDEIHKRSRILSKTTAIPVDV